MSGNINTSNLYRKSVTKDMSGNIINMLDEANGGYIIRNRQIVNQERWNEVLQKEKDRQEAAKAAAHQIESPYAEQRTMNPAQAKESSTKMEAFEQRLNSQDEKLDAILKAISTK